MHLSVYKCIQSSIIDVGLIYQGGYQSMHSPTTVWQLWTSMRPMVDITEWFFNYILTDRFSKKVHFPKINHCRGWCVTALILQCSLGFIQVLRTTEVVMWPPEADWMRPPRRYLINMSLFTCLLTGTLINGVLSILLCVTMFIYWPLCIASALTYKWVSCRLEPFVVFSGRLSHRRRRGSEVNKPCVRYLPPLPW